MNLPDRLGLIDLLGQPAFLHDQDIPVLAWYAAQVPEQGHIVEIGAAYGASAYVLLVSSKPTVQVRSIDPFVVDPIGNWQATDGKCRVALFSALSTMKNLAAGHRWSLIVDTSHNVATGWQNTWQPIDLLVIDGDHLLPGVLEDFHDWVGYVRPGGIILLHDSRHDPKLPPETHAAPDSVEGGLPGPTYVAQEVMANSPLVELIDGKAGFAYTAWRRTEVDAGITLFTTVKQFSPGQNTINQTNMLLSLQRLIPRPEVLVFCDQEDAADVSLLGGQPILEFPRTDRGYPYMDGMYEIAQERAKHDQMVYINADIVVPTNFPWVLRAVEAKFGTNYLIVGQRWDVDLPLWDFDDPYCGLNLYKYVATNGKLHGPTGKDYFAFKRPLNVEILPFSIMRTNSDNWILLNAIKNGMAVVDATEALFVVHGNHDLYTTSKNVIPGITGANFQDDPEVQRNWALSGEDWNRGHIDDAPWILRADGTFDRRFA